MPQLNPSPWFFILTATWTVLLLIILPKVMSYVLPNNPAHKDSQKSKRANWAWPWP
uniref:ATP synthase F0 subunit 8 n=1 Tax=Rexea antefurcata TaxID=887133 RepID=UPI002207AD59|nr:ATP synthase F0 subunit 8 [Rexea antefurcata]UXX50398.1 ATP synthase F0 subunit 8 [Rexea antefurcata]